MTDPAPDLSDPFDRAVADALVATDIVSMSDVTQAWADTLDIMNLDLAGVWEVASRNVGQDPPGPQPGATLAAGRVNFLILGAIISLASVWQRAQTVLADVSPRFEVTTPASMAASLRTGRPVPSGRYGPPLHSPTPLWRDLVSSAVILVLFPVGLLLLLGWLSCDTMVTTCRFWSGPTAMRWLTIIIPIAMLWKGVTYGVAICRVLHHNNRPW